MGHKCGDLREEAQPKGKETDSGSTLQAELSSVFLCVPLKSRAQTTGIMQQSLCQSDLLSKSVGLGTGALLLHPCLTSWGCFYPLTLLTIISWILA